MNTLGLVVGNRGFFPDHLCATGREAAIKVLREQGLEVVALPTDATKFGAVESLDVRDCVVLSAPHLVNVQIDDMRRGIHEHLELGTGETGGKVSECG